MLRRTVVPIALLLAACGSQPTNNTTPDTGPGTIGRSCNVDEECGGLKCDPGRRQCICGSDDDCAKIHASDGLVFCNNFTGLCVAKLAGCTDDSACPGGYCDTRVRACKPRKSFCESCTIDHECATDADICIADTSLKQSFCGKYCTAGGSECPAGTACTNFSGRMQCWPSAGKNCKVFMGCIPDSKKSCNSTPDCADTDQICDPSIGLCVARVQICPFGQICDATARTCVDACQSDADCIAIKSNLRCVSRACEPIGECGATTADPSGDKSCPANKVCSFDPAMTSGTCVPFCGNDQDCPLATICAPTTDNRRKCQTGCRGDADCGLSQTCNKPTGAIGTCQGTTGTTCQADQVCPVCGTCDTNAHACVIRSRQNDGYCRPCGTDADCGDPTTGHHCLTLSGGLQRCGQPCPVTGCPKGFICNDICVGGQQQGYQCVGGKTFAECIPVDQSCLAQDGSEKCLP
jgi:hypothetical protein